MDLFEMLEDNHSTNIQNDSSDYKKEYRIVLQNYGIEAPDALLEELASYHLDPPPWAPGQNNSKSCLLSFLTMI